MKSTAKAIALLRDVSDKLNIRLGQDTASGYINTVRSAFDADGWPMLFLSANGNEAEGQPVILIRIKAADAVSTDVFGNDLIAFAPHALEFAYELTSAGAPEPKHTDLLTAEFEAIKTGVVFQLKEIANGTAVTEAAINAAAPLTNLEDIDWPTKGV